MLGATPPSQNKIKAPEQYVHEETLREIVDELDKLLPGRFLGRVFQLSALSLAFDFGLKNHGYLFISIEPAAPSLYLIKRTTRELEKASVPPSSFAQAIRTSLGGGSLQALVKDSDERVVRFSFLVEDDLADSHNKILVAQLTGRSANCSKDFGRMRGNTEPSNQARRRTAGRAAF